MSKPRASTTRKGEGKYEDRMKGELFKKMLNYGAIVLNFSVPSTFLLALLFDNMFMLYCFFTCVPIYFMVYFLYEKIYKRQEMTYQRGVLVFFSVMVMSMLPLTYLAGGYSGAMISAFFIILIFGGFFLDRRQAQYVSAFVLLVYMSFFFAQELGFYSSPIEDPAILSYAKAIIDIIMITMVVFIMPMLSDLMTDSISYYRIRGERMKKKRKELEALVKKRTRDLDRANRRLRDTAKKKDEFISVLAHELQIPMTSVIGFSQLLKDKKSSRDRKKREQYLNIIENESKRMSKMIKDLLDLSRIDIGTVKIAMEKVDTKKAIETVVLELQSMAKKKGLVLTADLEKRLPPMTTDKEKFTQILINLITNSIKYTEKGNVTVSAVRKGKMIEFHVADTGIGISRDQQKRVFERFYRTDAASKKATGVGLGLSIVKEFVEVLGGKIWLESEVDVGSTFYFNLPIKGRRGKPRKKL